MPASFKVLIPANIVTALEYFVQTTAVWCACWSSHYLCVAIYKRVLYVFCSAGIVHSDLKPANFILAGGIVKLIDFGIAKTIQPDRTSVTCDQIVGTFSYMSPEAIIDLNGGVGLFGNSKANIKVLGILMLSLYGSLCSLSEVLTFQNIEPFLILCSHFKFSCK